MEVTYNILPTGAFIGTTLGPVVFIGNEVSTYKEFGTDMLTLVLGFWQIFKYSLYATIWKSH